MSLDSSLFTGDVVQFRRLTIVAAVILVAGCGGGGTEQTASAADNVSQATTQQATLPATLCSVFPRADAERILGKALVEQRNDEWACHYQDAKGTEGRGVNLDRNVLEVKDQCRMVPHSETLSGFGSDACIATNVPSGGWTTVVFRASGQTFEATAPGEDQTTEKATAVAKLIQSKLGS
jgi:hypothetical protein